MVSKVNRSKEESEKENLKVILSDCPVFKLSVLCLHGASSVVYILYTHYMPFTNEHVVNDLDRLLIKHKHSYSINCFLDHIC